MWLPGTESLIGKIIAGKIKNDNFSIGLDDVREITITIQ